MKLARPRLFATTVVAAALTIVAYLCVEELDQPDVLPIDGRRLSQEGTLSANATAKVTFLGGVEKLYGQASPGCMSCCDGGTCSGAYEGTQAGMCCAKAPSPFCCPSGTMCVTGPQLGCRPAGGYGGQGQMGGQGYGGYGNQNSGYGYGGSGMAGYPQLTPMQKIMRFIRDHMMVIWLVLLVLGCLGIGGGCTHQLQQLLCGLSLFNMFAPQGMQNEMYGPPGSY